MTGRPPKYSSSGASNKPLPEIPLGVVPVPKATVRRPQMVLKEEHLTSKKGIACLPEVFKEAKFKGKGHELEDLRMLLSKSKHWAHRLFPKITFEDFVDKAEVLGKKNSVKNCLTKIRHGMPLHFSEELVISDNEDEDKDKIEAQDQEVPEKEDSEAATTGTSELKFDRLFREFSSHQDEEMNTASEAEEEFTSQQQKQSSKTDELTTEIEKVSSQNPKHQQPSVEEFTMDDTDFDEDFLSSFKP